MFLVLFLIGGSVFALRFLGASRSAQYAVAGIGAVFVLTVQLTLPSDNTLRQATGGSLKHWLILLGVLIAILGYARFVGQMKKMAEPKNETNLPEKMTDAELDRYARHIVLREIGGAGQKKMRKSKVLIVGAGGLGCPASMYLAAAGVGTIGLIDDDVVSQSNLQRQVLFRDADIDTPKVFAAQTALQEQNPFVTVKPYNRLLDREIAEQLVSEFDLVLDGTDNFKTRNLVNRACVATGTPLISGAISQWEGQLSVFDPASDGPCYACIFPEEPADGLAPSCAEAGVVGSLPGVIGSMMATEAIKFVTGAGSILRGEMLIFDALFGESRKIKLTKRADCTVCGTK